MSVDVEVKLVGILRGLAGTGNVSLKLEKPAALREVIRRLTESFPRNFKRALIDQELDDPRPNALILVNGREISVLEGLETEIKDGDSIVLVPVTHGG